MEIDNLMTMPEYSTDIGTEDDVWSALEDRAWEDEKVKEMLD